MVKIPNIKISAGRKREKCILDFDVHTTANFGFVQPTMAREMIPNSKFTVSINDDVKLAPLPQPTLGRIYMTHKHVFIPYRDVCPQFDSFISGQSYSIPGTSGQPLASYIPNLLPQLNLTDFARATLALFADWTIHVKRTTTVGSDDELGLYVPLLLDQNRNETQLNEIKEAWDIINTTTGNNLIYGQTLRSNIVPYSKYQYLPNGIITQYQQEQGITSLTRTGVRGVMRCGNWTVNANNGMTSSDSNFAYWDSATKPNGVIRPDYTNYYVPMETADYLCVFGNPSGKQYTIAFKLKPAGKRVRQILTGLGYWFNPNMTLPACNWLKLLAYYKAWFCLYRPQRNISFTQTKCYEMIKRFEVPQTTIAYPAYDFIFDLGTQTNAYLPQDYFGMALERPYQSFNDLPAGYASARLDVPTIKDNDDNPLGAYINFTRLDANRESDLTVHSDSGSSLTQEFPALVQASLHALKYVGKNSVVGKSIKKYLLAHYGINIDDSHDIDSVRFIGEVSTPISISPVQSTASTEQDELGAYAGYGIGINRQDNSFTFENKDNFGVWLTLTCIMPKSGYYQGVLRENQANGRYEFFTSEFDAMGYQVLNRGEVSCDYPVATQDFNLANRYESTKAFGFVPRYSHYKVGRDIVNGDLSLRSYDKQLSGFHLERKLPYEFNGSWILFNSAGNWNKIIPYIGEPSFMPSLVTDEFRKIDPLDKIGMYNRVFYDESVIDDHFIIGSVFSVTAYLPAKSLSESFDTLTDEDGNVIDVSHQ